MDTDVAKALERRSCSTTMGPAPPSPGPSSFHAGDPAIAISTSGLHSDGRKPLSWSILPSEIQQEILAPLLQFDCPISMISHPWTSKALLRLLLVNKQTYAQARRLYQQNRFFLNHGKDSNNTYQGTSPHDKALTYPKAQFCHNITNLTLRFFPKFICSMDVLQDSDSWAPLFRYRSNMRLVRARDPRTAALEAESARRIAWQASFTSLRCLKIHFDFIWTKDQRGRDNRHAKYDIHSSVTCCDQGPEAFTRMLGSTETAFPNVEEVDVQVRHVICSGYTGKWSTKEGLEETYNWGRQMCSDKCPQKIGEALEAALLR